MTHKRNLEKSTRIDEENKNRTTGIFIFLINCAWLYRFIWNCIMQTGLWNLNHRKFKILSQQWHWNYTKTVSQLIVINFAKSLPDYCIFCTRITHWTYFIYHFFCTWNFDVLLFSNFFITLSRTQIQNFRNFQ